MANYQRLWRDVTSALDEAKAVRTLAGILTDKEGRTFILNLERRDAELCIEILDRVSHHLDLGPPFVLSNGFIRALRTTTSKLQRNKASSIR